MDPVAVAVEFVVDVEDPKTCTGAGPGPGTEAEVEVVLSASEDEVGKGGE